MNDLVAVFGEPFLSYVLGVETVAGPTEESLSGEQCSVADKLRAAAAQTQDQHPMQRLLNLEHWMSEYLPTAQTTVANAFRSICGGQILEIEPSEDEVASLLAHLARDAYPTFLLPDADDRYSLTFGMSKSANVFGHPAYDDLCRAVLVDDALKFLFPGAPDVSTLTDTAAILRVQSTLYFSQGHARGFQLAMMAGTMLTNAYGRWLLAGEPGPDRFIESVCAILAEVRQLALGRVVQVPLLVGFKNVDIPSDMTITLPWGKLRRRHPVDDKFVGGDPEARLILAARAPMRILRKEGPSEGGQEQEDQMFHRMEELYPRFEEANRAVTRTSDLTRYALLLGSTERPYLAAQQTASAVLDPINHSVPAAWRADNSLFPAQATNLDAERAQSVEAWGARLAAHPKSLDTAMRRTLSAVASRTDPVDGFVDAVLAWENMFSDTPETTFKVCGAITVLIGPGDLEGRKTFFAEVQKLYQTRSQILHGGNEPGIREAVRHRDRAVEIAVDCMRALHEHGDLLALPNSAQRGKHILLGSGAPRSSTIAVDG